MEKKKICVLFERKREEVRTVPFQPQRAFELFDRMRNYFI